MIDSVHQENVDLALKLKQKGYPIYLLSNFPGDQFEKYRLQNSFLDEFDDRIISGDVGLAKPDIKIYQLAIKKFILTLKNLYLLMIKLKTLKGLNR